MLLTDIFKNSAEKFGNRPALVMKMGYRTVRLTYADVNHLARRVGVFLGGKGLKRGDKVAILAPNSPYWTSVWWGCLLGGYAPVPLNVQSTGEMVEKIVAQSETKAIFVHLHYKQDLPAHLQRYTIEYLPEIVSDADPDSFRPLELSEDDIAELMYTSGTTGDPKGVMLTHKNIASNLEALSSTIPVAKKGVSEKSVFLSILPLSHIFEQVAGFLLPFSRGAMIVYAHSPAAIRDLLQEYRATHLTAVPEFLRIVMSRIEAKAEEEGKGGLLKKLMALSLKIKSQSLRRILFHKVHKGFGGRLHTVASGGAPLGPELGKKWDALGIELLQGYGLTETSPVVASNTHEENRLGSVGKVLPGVEVKLAEDGEILVKGPNVFSGYYKNPEKTKEAFTPDGSVKASARGAGWFKTGDIGELDKDGFLYIKGRKKYMIKGPGAQNVYPEDIEFELNKIPGVKDSCVVGLEKGGGKVEVYAVLLLDKEKPAGAEQARLPSPSAQADGGQAVKAANEKLASYQHIQSWSVWPEEDFPRSATRKVKKEEVLKWLRKREGKVLPSDLSVKASASAGALAKEGKTPLMKLLAEVTDHDIVEIRETTKVVPELGLDSLLRVELASRIEEKFGVTVDEARIHSATTVADIEEMVRKQEPVEKAPPLKRWPRWSIVSWIRFIAQKILIFPLARLFVKLKIAGLENLDNLLLPAVFMPSHISYLDSLALIMALPSAIRHRVAFAAAKDMVYERYKSIAWLIELWFNSFPFPRREHENIKAGLDSMGRLLDDRWSIVVYPEGRMSIDAKLQPLKRGAGLIAVEIDAPIVPVYIRGTDQIMPYGKILPRKRASVMVIFGKPMKFERSDSYIEATEKLQETLRNLQD